MVDCHIENVGKARNGSNRYWCRTHGGNATGKGGTKLAKCERSDKNIDLEKCFEIDCDDFVGGVGIWGAVQPVFNTALEPAVPGVHVHARKSSMLDDKEIDDTFSAVRLRYRESLFEERSEIITDEAAVNYFISRLLNLELAYLFCPGCGNLHLDAEFFATKVHRKHLCNSCGRHFNDDRKSVSNPIVLLRKILGDKDEDRKYEPSRYTLEIKQRDYPGGIQLWASNPAILWTVPRPEQSGIHVHLYAPDGVTRRVDETFKSVRIDEIDIDEDMVRYLMAQNTLPHIVDRIESLKCRHCGSDHFDTGHHAFHPHNQHNCNTCGKIFLSPRRKKVVSNPLKRQLDALRNVNENTAGKK